MQRIEGAVALLFVLSCLAAGLEKEYKGTIIEVIDGDTYLFRTIAWQQYIYPVIFVF